MSLTLKGIYAPLPKTERGKSTVINGDPKGANMVYCNGSNVIIRNVATPGLADIYSEHSHATTVAKYSPSGFYIASGDSTGAIRIWDTVNKEHILKIEVRPISGAILDIDWTEDSKRIVAVGDGREKFGACFMWDSGASVGEITGHSKTVTTCAFRQQRPYRMVTGGEDFSVNWFEGPPFKFKKGINDHSRFVNSVRFAPTGDLFISVGQDKLGLIYDGKDGTKKMQLADEKNGGHKGGIYAVSWKADSTQVLTASGDKTAKIFDVTTGQCVQTFNIGSAVEDQQLGCLWQGSFLLSCSLSSQLNYLDPGSGQVVQKLEGHSKFVTALDVDPAERKIYSGSYDANVVRWNVSDAATTPFEGKGHSNQIARLTLASGKLVTGAMDDSVRITPVSGALSYAAGQSISTDAPVTDVATSTDGSLQVAVTAKSVYVIRGGAIASTLPFAAEATAVAISGDGKTVLVGAKNNTITKFTLSGASLSEAGKITAHRGAISRIVYSPDGSHFAAADVNRDLYVYKADGTTPLNSGWCFHTARITDVAWSPNGKNIATTSLDQNIIVWDVQAQDKRVTFKNAHFGGANCARFLDETTLVTAGQDCAIKTWTFTA